MRTTASLPRAGLLAGPATKSQDLVFYVYVLIYGYDCLKLYDSKMFVTQVKLYVSLTNKSKRIVTKTQEKINSP